MSSTVNVTENYGEGELRQFADYYYNQFLQTEARAKAAMEEARAMAGNVASGNIVIRQLEEELQNKQKLVETLQGSFTTQNDANEQQHKRIQYLERLICGIADEIGEMTDDIRDDYFAVLFPDGSPEPRSYLSHIAQVVKQAEEKGNDCGCTGSE